MPESLCDHEKLRAYQEALRFVAWAEPVLRELPGSLAARDQLDRASTSDVLNMAEGNGKRSGRERCRFFAIARGSALECAACLEVLSAKSRLPPAVAIAGKTILAGVVSLSTGLIARFSDSSCA